jgi:hypothetical protein
MRLGETGRSKDRNRAPGRLSPPAVLVHLHQLESRPLSDYQVVIETIAATTTEAGLSVEAVLDEGTYPTGVKVTNA